MDHSSSTVGVRPTTLFPAPIPTMATMITPSVGVADAGTSTFGSFRPLTNIAATATFGTITDHRQTIAATVAGNPDLDLNTLLGTLVQHPQFADY